MSKEYLLQLLQKIPMKDNVKPVLNTKPNPFIEFDKDCLTATYVGKNLIYSDTTSIQSNRPANRENLIYYYEIIIKDLAKSDISVGFADSDFPMNKHPGHTKNSYGYQSDGQVYSSKKIQKRLQKMKDLDVIGCGINFLKKEIFFTYNGIYCGPQFQDIDSSDYYPTLGMHGPRQKIKFNFGQEKFKFNLDSHIQEEKEAILQIILEHEVHHYDIHKLVQSYLYFNGYFETLSAFENASKMSRESTHLLLKDNYEGLNPSQIATIRKYMDKKQLGVQDLEYNQHSSKQNQRQLGAEKMMGEDENSMTYAADSNFQCHSFQTSQMNENSTSFQGLNNSQQVFNQENQEKINIEEEEEEEESKKEDSQDQKGNNSNGYKHAKNQNQQKESQQSEESSQHLDYSTLNNSSATTTIPLNSSHYTQQNGNGTITQNKNEMQENNNSTAAILNNILNNSNNNNHNNNNINKTNGNNYSSSNNVHSSIHNSNQNLEQNGNNHNIANNNNNIFNHQSLSDTTLNNKSNNNNNNHISIPNKQNQMQIEIDSPLFKKTITFEKKGEKESSKEGCFSNGLLDEQTCMSGGGIYEKSNISPEQLLQATLEQNKDILEQFRSDILKLIAVGNSEECIKKIKNQLPQLLLQSKEILPNLYAQAFIERIKSGQILDAVIFAQRNLSNYQNETFYSYNENGFVIPISINDLMGLAAISDYTKYTGLQFLLSQNQRYIIQDLINKSILELFGCADISILELLLKQLQQIANHFKQEKYYIGEIYQLKI